MNVTYLIDSTASLVPNRAVRVYAYRNGNIICGEYDGYWEPERGIVRLYPARGSWIYGRLVKITISDMLVRRKSNGA